MSSRQGESSGGESSEGKRGVRPLTIDLHTHILPDTMPDWNKRFGYGDFIRVEPCDDGCKANMFKGDKFFRQIEPNCFDPAARMVECDAQHVDVQVLSTVPVMFNYSAKPEDTLTLSRFLNDHIAGITKAHPDRFVGLGTVPMQQAELAITELRRCVNELGMSGIQIGTHINDWRLSADELFPVFAEAEKLGASVFVHPWDMEGVAKGDKYWLPWLVDMPAETSNAICSLIFAGVMEKLPALKFAFAHGGGSFPGTFARIQHGYDVRPDLCAVDNPHEPREYLGRFWLDSLVHDPAMLDVVVDLVGEDRVILGTDYPFPLGELEPGALVESMDHWSDEKKAKILGGNALEFLGVEAERFKKNK